LRSVQWLCVQFDKAGVVEPREDDGGTDGIPTDGNKRPLFEDEVVSAGALDTLLALVSAADAVLKVPQQPSMTTGTTLLAINLLTGMVRLRQRTLRWLAQTAQVQVLCTLLQRLTLVDTSCVNSLPQDDSQEDLAINADADRPTVDAAEVDNAKEQLLVGMLQLLGVVADGSASAAHTCVELGEGVSIALSLLTPSHAGVVTEPVAAESCCLLAKLTFQHGSSLFTSSPRVVARSDVGCDLGVGARCWQVGNSSRRWHLAAVLSTRCLPRAERACPLLGVACYRARRLRATTQRQ